MQDPLVKDVLDDLESRFSDRIISVFGIGSYFDENLPPNWIKNDVDLIVIVDSLESVPKQDWTEVRYEKKQIGDKEIWIGFNSLEGVKNPQLFRQESFASFEWNLLDLRLPSNSALLYGRNVRNELPKINAIQFDCDDILVRSLYHLNNSFKEGITPKAMREFTKGIFKFGFYLCIYFDPQFRFTSSIKITEKIKNLVSSNKLHSIINFYFEEAVIYRITAQFKSEFKSLRDDFVKFAFFSLASVSVRQKMDRKELIKLLSVSFGGLAYLVRFARKLESLETLETPKIIEDEDFSFVLDDSRLKIFGIEPNMKSITIYGRIKEIHSKFRFEKADGNKGEGASFLLHDPTGDIRVYFVTSKSKSSFSFRQSSDYFNVGRTKRKGKWDDVDLSLIDNYRTYDLSETSEAQEVPENPIYRVKEVKTNEVALIDTATKETVKILASRKYSPQTIYFHDQYKPQVKAYKKTNLKTYLQSKQANFKL